MSASKSTNVFLFGSKVGVLTQDNNGLTFEYTHPSHTPVSLAMPYRDAPYTDRRARAFVLGLLPDSDVVRSYLAKKHDLPRNDLIGMLDVVGLDCAGAVQFSREESLPERQGKLAYVSDHDIANRLVGIINEREDIWGAEEGEHWSLGGTQSKFSLRLVDGQWFIPMGDEPGSHIIKPGIGRLRHNALIESVTMKVAGSLGINVAGTEYHEFDGVPALLSKRYDRYEGGGGELLRAHQEDMCQALSVMPVSEDTKYQVDSDDIFALLGRTAQDAESNKRKFADALMFNYLSLSPDAHAKNYSLIIGGDAATFAPLYDVASGAAQVKDEQRYGDKLRYPSAAMSIGLRKRFGRVDGDDLKALSVMSEVPLREVRERFLYLASKIPSAFDEALEASGASAEVLDEVRATPLLNNLRVMARKSLERCDFATTSTLPSVDSKFANAKSSTPACGRRMPRARANCVLPVGHGGPHRSKR